MLADLKGTAEALRRHHALEHATIYILLGRVPPGTRLIGWAAADGFYLLGDVPTEELEAAAAEALARLRAGEGSLAISPGCGTNLALAGAMAGVASLLALGREEHPTKSTISWGPRQGRWQRLPEVLTSAVLAVVLAQPLGRLAQRYVTTSPHLEGTEIAAVRQESVGRWRYHHVVTRGKGR